MKRFVFLLYFILLSADLIAEGKVITTVVEDFKGKLFLYEDKEEALKGLKSHLNEKIEDRLRKMGFSEDYIISLLKKANYSGMEVVEKRVEILKNGKRVKTTAFDISGSISVEIDEGDMRELGEILKRASPINDAEREQYREALKNFLVLSASMKDLDLSVLKIKLAEIIKADLFKKIQITFGSDNTSFSSLKDRVLEVLEAIEGNKKWLREDEDINEIVQVLINNIESYYKRSLIDVSSVENAIDFAKKISQSLPVKREETFKELNFIIEFKWAENIQNISSNSNVELERIWEEVDNFVKHFKGSRFLKNIKSRLVSRLSQELTGEDLNYDKFQYLLKIFDRLNLTEISKGVIKGCESVMGEVESSSDDVSEKINESFQICIKYSDGVTKKRLLTLKDKFIKSDKNRVYKNMLGSLAFIMRLVKYADSIPFGLSSKEGSLGKFAEFLNEGSLTSGCQCASGESDECRIFVYAGDQFEVVLRYENQRVYELTVCNMNIKGKSSVLLTYLKENFKPLFKGSISSVEDRDETFEFEVRRDEILSLEKVGYVANLSIYHKKYKPVREKVSYSETNKEIPIKNGDCVEWDCEFECKYKGKVERIYSDEAQVVITSAPKVSELNMRKRLKKSLLKRCE